MSMRVAATANRNRKTNEKRNLFTHHGHKMHVISVINLYHKSLGGKAKAICVGGERYKIKHRKFSEDVIRKTEWRRRQVVVIIIFYYA